MKKLLKQIYFIIPILMLIIGLYTVPIKIFHTDFSKIIGDKGDARFNNYILEHGYKYLKGDIANYWDIPMMHPLKNVTAFSDNLLGTMPIYSLFREIGYERETSFQFWIICIFGLNFIFSFWVFNKISSNVFIASAAAYIFAFGIYNIGHFEHVQVFPKFIAPLVLFWTWQFLSNKKLKYFLFASLGVVFQFYCGIYLGFFLIYGIFFLSVAYFITYKDWDFFLLFKQKKNIIYISFVIIFCAILLSFLMIPYFKAIEITENRSYDSIFDSIPRPISYFFTHIAAKNWYILTQHSQFAFPNWWSHFHFVGILPWIGILVSIALILKQNKLENRQNKLLKFLLLALFLNIIFCLNIHEFSLYRLIHYLPGFKSMRSIDRIINIQVIFFLFIFVVSFNELKINYKLKQFILLILPFIAIYENIINNNELKIFDKKDSQNEINLIVNNINKQYNNKYKAIAYMPILSKPDSHDKIIETNISAILAAQYLNIPVVNAYTGNYPEKYMSFFDNMDITSLKQWCDYSKCDINSIQKINDINKNIKEIKSINIKSANGKYISISFDNPKGTPFLIADKDHSLSWELFKLVVLNNNSLGLLSFQNKFISSNIENKNELTVDKDLMCDWETFYLYKINKTYYAIKAINGKYLSVDKKTNLIFANSDNIGECEKFEIIYL